LLVVSEVPPLFARSAGGTFGKIEATREEQYFRELVSLTTCQIVLKQP